jgi:diaminopimelate epimerase
VRFQKTEGVGNDYVLVDVFDQRVSDPSALSRTISDRHRGIGSDGLLLIGPPRGAGAQASMRMFNADGSEGRMCGNGLRCVVRWLVESGHAPGPDVTVETAAGLRQGRVLADHRVELMMGVPDFSPQALPVRLPGDGRQPPELPLRESLGAAVAAELRADPDVGLCVSVGNPHLVLRVSDPAAVDLARHGAALERSPLFPEGTNVHFVALTGERRIEARPWERGSGATRACGTGAVAIAVVAMRAGWIEPGRVAIDMPGGELSVRWDGEGPAWLEGPARLPFSGEWRGT